MRNPPRAGSRVALSCAAVGVASLCGTPGIAHAGNDDSILQGSDAALTAGAVTATTEDGASAYYNPAGIAHIGRGQVNVSAQVIQLQSLTIDDLLSVDGGPSVDGSALVIPMLPAGVTYGGKLSDVLSWGGGIFVSNQFAYTLRSSLVVPRAPPLDATIAFENREINTLGGFGLGWSVLPSLRLGAALFGRYRERYGAQVLSAGSVTPNPDDPTDAGNLEGFNRSFGSQAAGAEVRVGLQWEPAAGWVVGAAVWTPTINLYQARQETGARSTRRDGASGGEAVTRYDPFNTSTTAWGFEQASSWRFRAGLAYQGAWGWASVDADVQTALDNVELGIERELTFNVRAGAKLRVGEAASVGFGLFTDRTATPTGGSRALQPRISLYGGTFGFDYDTAHRLRSDEEASSISFRTGLALRVAYGRGDYSALQFDADPADPSVQQNRVDASLLEAGVYLTSGMYF